MVALVLPQSFRNGIVHILTIHGWVIHNFIVPSNPPQTRPSRKGPAMSKPLFSEIPFGRTTLKNRIVMAPMTRSRAIGNVPGELVAEYYGQRAGAGLIVTEGTSPSPNGLGYARIPGLFSAEQVRGWRQVTDRVH